MSRTKASFSHLQNLINFYLLEGSLARKLRFYVFKFQTLRYVSHEGFVFTFSTFRLWGMSRTKASFLHLQLLDFAVRLARKLHFHFFNFQTLRCVSHETFVFTSSSFTFWGKSRTQTSLSHLLNFQTLRDVSHESFLFLLNCFHDNYDPFFTALTILQGLMIRLMCFFSGTAQKPNSQVHLEPCSCRACRSFYSALAFAKFAQAS